jgi:hypothetical protein
MDRARDFAGELGNGRASKARKLEPADAIAGRSGDLDAIRPHFNVAIGDTVAKANQLRAHGNLV